MLSLHYKISLSAIIPCIMIEEKDLQNSQGQDEDNGNFCAWIHLHLPYERDRQQSKRPICDRRHSRMGICDVCQGFLPQTTPSASSNRVLGPKVIDWTALEKQKEKIHSREEHDNSEGRVDDTYLIEFGGEAEEVDADRQFSDSCGDDV